MLKSTGGFTKAWTTVTTAPTFAKVRGLYGYEVIMQDRVTDRQVYELICHYFSGHNETLRVLIDSRYYNVRRSDNLEFRNQYLRMEIERGVAA